MLQGQLASSTAPHNDIHGLRTIHCHGVNGPHALQSLDLGLAPAVALQRSVRVDVAR